MPSRDDLDMGKRDVLTERQWARINELLPPEQGPMGRPAKPNRPIVWLTCSDFGDTP